MVGLVGLEINELKKKHRDTSFVEKNVVPFVIIVKIIFYRMSLMTSNSNAPHCKIKTSSL